MSARPYLLLTIPALGIWVAASTAGQEQTPQEGQMTPEQQAMIAEWMALNKPGNIGNRGTLGSEHILSLGARRFRS